MAIYRDESSNIIRKSPKNSSAKIAANNKYTNEHYTEKKVRFRNDFFTDTVKPYLDNTGLSINGLITKSVAYCISHNIDFETTDSDSDQD